MDEDPTIFIDVLCSLFWFKLLTWFGLKLLHSTVLRKAFDFLRLENSKKSDRASSFLERQINKLGHKAQGRSNVDSYFRRHEVVLTRSHWQVRELNFKIKYSILN